MKNWLNVRTVSFVVWVIVSIITIVTMPNLDTLVREKGQTEIPSYMQSQVASKLLTEMDGEGTETYQFIVVFNTGTVNPLTDAQIADINETILQLKENSDALGVTNILTHIDSEETEKQLVAEDGTTILTQIAVDEKVGTVDEVAKSLEKFTSLKSVDSYLTGTDIVLDDFAKSSQEGIQKTEIIAIIFIIIVLVLVFRSPVVPIISLLTVGVSYIVSLGIVTQLVDHFNFPFSNFTQVFLIVILFGIGTDYNILLYTRFKEELGKQGHILKAITETYRTAGRTVIYSGIAVFIGFMALYLAEFKLYQATSAVAIGVAVLLLVLITLNPFFMAVLGIKMFWPAKNINGHEENKLWHFLAKQSFFRPITALVIIAVIIVPFMFTYSGELNYDDLVEISDKYKSKQAITVIEDHFSAGFSSPTNLVIKANESLATQEGLKDIDQLVEAISKVEGVSEVYTVTRPTGERITELYIDDQVSTLNNGLDDAQEGLGTINDGLSDAESELGQFDESNFDSVNELITGTETMESGVGQLRHALSLLVNGFESGAVGAEQLATNLSLIEDNVRILKEASLELQVSYSQLATGFQSFSQLFDSINSALKGVNEGYQAVEQSMLALIQSNPELQTDQNVQTALQTAIGAKQNLAPLLEQLSTVTPQYNLSVQSFKQANDALLSITSGLQQIEEGIVKLQDGAETLAQGLETGVVGATQVTTKTADIENGISAISEGHKQLQLGLTELQDKMSTLQGGLAQSTDGLTEINEGLVEAKDYLNGLSASNKVFYIPQDVLDGDDFEESLNMYMSENRQMVKMMIILEANPYSKEAMLIIEDVDAQINAMSSNLSFHDAEFALGGKSAVNVDLQNMSSSDFTRTIFFMLIGIFLVLIIITRSLWQPVVIIGSLILAYFTTLGITELISEHVLGQSILSWNVPFFSFIMIVALGVDYSIFLMMRYREVEAKGAKGIIEAAKHIGGVVLSAALILGGTFAALIPSGILTLMQVAVFVMVGLIILSLIMLPIFLPAVMGGSTKLQKVSKKHEK